MVRDRDQAEGELRWEISDGATWRMLYAGAEGESVVCTYTLLPSLRFRIDWLVGVPGAEFHECKSGHSQEAFHDRGDRVGRHVAALVRRRLEALKREEAASA